MNGQGNAGTNGGSYGDLYIIIAVRPHDIFERDNYDLHCDIPVSYADLVLGAEIDVPTLEEKVKFHIPEGTQSGTQFCLRGKGINKVNSSAKGDVYFRVVMETPRNVSSEAKEVLKKFAELTDNSNYVKRQSFLDKLTRIFRKNGG